MQKELHVGDIISRTHYTGNYCYRIIRVTKTFAEGESLTESRHKLKFRKSVTGEYIVHPKQSRSTVEYKLMIQLYKEGE
jgi:hypothetical protein